MATVAAIIFVALILDAIGLAFGFAFGFPKWLGLACFGSFILSFAVVQIVDEVFHRRRERRALRKP